MLKLIGKLQVRVLFKFFQQPPFVVPHYESFVIVVRELIEVELFLFEFRGKAFDRLHIRGELVVCGDVPFEHFGVLASV